MPWNDNKDGEGSDRRAQLKESSGFGIDAKQKDAKENSLPVGKNSSSACSIQ